MSLQAGEQLGAYTILGLLGAGGMGEVYRARDTRLDRLVAIKVLPERCDSDDQALRRFEREAKAVAALSHPNILTIYDVGRDHGVSFAVMELLEGRSLRELLRNGPIPVKQVLELAIGLADGLTAAHAKGIVHRDLKPENIFVTTDSAVKILDFGLVRFTVPAADPSQAASDDPNQATSETITQHTTPGTLLGTVHYMSPEQAQALPLDARSDIFSLGCVLYEMVSGQCPFSRATVAGTLTAILRDEPPPLTASAPNAEVTSTLSDVIGKCLEKSPDQRIQSARDLASALRTIAALNVMSSGRAARRLPRRRAVWLMVLAGAAVATSIAYLSLPAERPDRIRSLAIMPLDNLANDAAQDFFADGMTEMLISELGRIEGLKVISRYTVMQYKGDRRKLPEIADELNVEAIVHGSVQRDGQRVRVIAHLIDARKDTYIWSDSFDHALRDMLTLQRKIAQTIAQQIDLTLKPAEVGSGSRARPVDPRAQLAYLRGRHAWNQRTTKQVLHAVDRFKEAIGYDPDYALAYLGLAEAYAVFGWYAIAPPLESLPKARSAAEQALKLDPSLGEAHATLALVQALLTWNWRDSERAFQTALRANPNHAVGRHWYSLTLAATGRFDEAIAQQKQAIAVDPLSPMTLTGLAIRYYNARKYELAAEELRQILKLHPNFAVAHFDLGLIAQANSQFVEAIGHHRQAVELSENVLMFQAALAHAHARSGQPQRARELLEKLTAPDAGEAALGSASAIALGHMGLGEIDQAFAWLQRAFEQNDPWLAEIQAYPIWDPLRGDERYHQLLRDMKLQP